MSFSDLFGSGEHLRNLSHFAAIVNLAAVDGAINEAEENLLRRFARKLDITESEYKKVLENPKAYPLSPSHDTERRLERLHDLFRIIFADNAIGLGFSSQASNAIIKRSIQIFGGQISFEDYQYLLEKED